jgi:alpha-D-ribose 1-methylphosphonate 5-triphosphate synthase subunit PhnG
MPASQLENHAFVTKSSWRFTIKLSIIIDNLFPASGNSGKAMSTRDEGDGGKARRKAAMAVLVLADAAEIAAHLDAVAVPAYENLREAENGLVMARGRIGGDGAPFNLGEATISRAAVRLASGEVGFGYTLGRDRDKARMIALCDALVQSRDFADSVEAKVIAPLRATISARHAQRAAEAAATRVDFYTMVRGEG